MKSYNRRQIKSFLLAGAMLLIMASTSACEATAQRWHEPPPLVLSDCVEVDRAIGVNPYSPMPNDFLLITSYEERKADSGLSGAINLGSRTTNIYLITGLLVVSDEMVGVPHSSSLIISVHTGGRGSEAETIREWILLDENYDGRVDKAVFSETVNGTRQEANEPGEMPGDLIDKLQSYYEKAVEGLSAKADGKNDDAASCMAV